MLNLDIKVNIVILDQIIFTLFFDVLKLTPQMVGACIDNCYTGLALFV
jgi:hypothetical protein